MENKDIENRAKIGLYIEKVKPEQSDKIYNGNNPEDVKNFFKEMKEQESDRLKQNERFISNIERELEIYNRDIYENMKTKEQALNLRMLLNSRLQVSNDSKELDSEDIERFENAIDKAKRLIYIINDKLELLPQKQSDNKIYREKLDKYKTEIKSICDKQVNDDDIDAFLVHGSVLDKLKIDDNVKCEKIVSVLIPIINTGIIPLTELLTLNTQRAKFIMQKFNSKITEKTFLNEISKYNNPLS